MPISSCFVFHTVQVFTCRGHFVMMPLNFTLSTLFATFFPVSYINIFNFCNESVQFILLISISIIFISFSINITEFVIKLT